MLSLLPATTILPLPRGGSPPGNFFVISPVTSTWPPPRGMSGASYLIFVELEFSFDCSPTLPGCLHHNWCPVVTAGVHILQASCQSSAAASGVRSRMELSVQAEDRVTVPLFCFLFYHIHAGTHTVTHIHALCTYIYTQHLHLHTQHIQTHMPIT